MSIIEGSLRIEAQKRYLNYALSVVTSRALPDVRDGLKPVQRRILYTMYNELRLTPDARFAKSARVVGDVLGKFHPHGDTAAYDAMVRMAQTWVMRAPLVDGQGNFGSPDGDSPAAYRYTEAKLKPIAMELLSELGKRTVGWRPNYDGTQSEPTVLPARFPNLLVNGSQGIAVGMATSVPPHNFNEVIDACVAVIDQRSGKGGEVTTKQVLKYIKGPDFPTGGQLLASKEELAEVYESGQGTLKLRGEYKLEEKRGGAVDIIITSVPYGVERSGLIEKIAEIITSKKLGALLNVRDESTDEVRVVLEIKRGTDPQIVMAYLYKHTSLQVSVSVNLTCLVPVKFIPGVHDGMEHIPPTPERLSLPQMITHFLDFRLETVTKRMEFDLSQLKGKIHTLEGFEKVFDALDETIRIIRKSEDKADAAEKLIKRFGLSEEQVDAILELKLYRLAKLQILLIQKELGEKRTEAKNLETLLASDAKRWGVVKTELLDLRAKYGDRRKTKVVGETDEPEFEAADFITAEDATAVLSTGGWIKRAREVKDLAATRLRDGDSVLSAVAGSTKHQVALFSSAGGCYVLRMNDVPATTGYGEPVQKFFKMVDGERILTMLSFDPRVLDVPAVPEGGSEPLPPFAVAITRSGLGFRFSLSPHREPSTKAGRRYAKLNEGDEIIFVATVGEKDSVIVAASDGHALGVAVTSLPLLSSVGKGVQVIHLQGDEKVIGAGLALSDRDTIAVETEKGKQVDISLSHVRGERNRAGEHIVKRDRFVKVIPPAATVPSLEQN